MEIPGDGGELEFEANYRLLGFGKQALVSPMAALGFPTFSTTERTGVMDVHLKKLEGYNAQMKVFIAQESTNGENFLVPLQGCKAILERLIAISQSKASVSNNRGFFQINISTIGRGHLNATYNFITEKILFYFKNIRQAKKDMGIMLLDVLCLIVTLDSECHTIFPQVFASCLLFFKPSSDWKDADVEVMNRLCYYVLPRCLVSEMGQYPWMNMSATLMMVLEGCLASKHHLLLVNTLMRLKRNVCSDILYAIAYGTVDIRQKSLHLLLHYWPIPIPEFTQYSNTIYGEWTTPVCESSDCQHTTSVATMLCMDPLCVAQYKQSGPTKLYMLLCPECDGIIHGSPPHRDHMRLQVPKPLHEVKPNCEFQKMCSGKERQINRAEVTCYDAHCTAIQHGQPIRMCRHCHNKQHKDIGDPKHIYQVCPPVPWDPEDYSSGTVMLEAISKLLETTPIKKDVPSRGVGTVPRSGHVNFPPFQIEMGTSREGMCMLSHYCTPTTTIQESQQDWLVHLIALVLNWLQDYYDLLHSASLSPDEGQHLSLGGGGTDFIDVGALQDYSRIFSNYADVSNLVNSCVLYWFRIVCESNIDCVSEVLKPDLSGCAQVGRLWNESHDQIERQNKTLSIIHTLYFFFQEGKLPEKTFMTLFKTVMPLWLDFLVSMRSEPRKMELLQEQIRKIFSHEKHAEGLKMFSIVWDLFRLNDPDSTQKALFWLQDLTRLNVPIAYLKHMFEDVLKEKRGKRMLNATKYRTHSIESGSSFDQESEKESFLSRFRRKDSTGSLSGYDSESALLSQPSFDGTGDTQVLITLNSSLTRFILMLDIWLSQLLKHQVPTLEASSLHAILVKMLGHVWGSNHTYQDHKESFNQCLLCRGMELWFGLASKLIEAYARKTREDSAVADEGGEELMSPSSQHPVVSVRSVKLIDKISTPIRRRKFTSTGDSSHVQRTRVKKMSQDSIEMLELTPNLNVSEEDNSLYLAELQKSRILQPSPIPLRPRKVAKVQSHSDLEVVSGGASGRIPGEQPKPSCVADENTTSALYTMFQMTIEKLTYKLHPNVLLQIIHCLTTLIRSGRVLRRVTDKRQIQTDLKQLLEKLWRCLETDTSNVVRSCVGLLLECANLMAFKQGKGESAKDGPGRDLDEDRVKSKLEDKVSKGKKEEKGGVFWKMLKDGLTSSNWSVQFRTIEKATSILQFMLSSEVVGLEYQYFHQSVKEALAHCFCLLTQLLQDKNSSVCSRARYCITSIKESSLEATRYFLTEFFRENRVYQPLVLQTLSILDSALPELNFVDLVLLNKLMNMALQNSTPKLQVEEEIKEMSETSLPTGGVSVSASKVSNVSSSSVSALFGGVGGSDNLGNIAMTQQILSLLLRHIGNARVKVKESMQRAQQVTQQVPIKKSATVKKSVSSLSSEEMFVQLLQRDIFEDFHCFPYELRNSLIFEVFLSHIITVLDHNVQFGHTKGLLSLILRLLSYSAAPKQEDLRDFDRDEKQSDGSSPTYGLGSLPPHLQAPWLRVFFVILYKYIHDYSDSDSANQRHVFSRARWCMKITLNSLEYLPHDCPLLNSADSRAKVKISLRRQDTVESFGSDGLLSSPSEGPPSAMKEAGLAQGRGGQDGSILADGPIHQQLVTENKSLSSDTKDPGNRVPPEGRCVVCNNPINELSEEVVALCAVVIGTYCNRLPHVVPSYLVSRIIPALSRVITPGFYKWQKFHHSNNPQPGSAGSVARHLLASILTQFAERRLFLYLFGYNYRAVARTVWTGVASSLDNIEMEASPDQTAGGGGGGGDKEEEVQLYQSSPIKYFLEDAISSLHIHQDITHHSFINLAAYLEAIDDTQSQAMPTIPPILLTKDLLLWDAFFKKLKVHFEVLRDKKAVVSLFQVINRLFQNTVDYQMLQYSLANYRAHSVQSLIQSLITIVETVLHYVDFPLGGVVTLGGLWYKVFQQHSQRDSEKLLKMFILELRKALKAKNSSTEIIRPENFLCLVQALLLEENGYLGYVDGLTRMKHFAPDLKQEYETHFLAVIQSSQWDFIDALNFLSTPCLHWPQEIIPQLKLSLAQLVALRVQHSRTPAEKLRKMVAGDNRAIFTLISKSGVAYSQWQSSLDSLHVLSWLLLGAISHNAIHSVASDMRAVTSSGGQCLILKSLSTKMEDVVQRAIALTKCVLQKVGEFSESEPKFDYIELVFLFGSILTVYMELYVVDGAETLILEYWEKVAGCLSHHLSRRVTDCPSPQQSSNNVYCNEVMHSLNEQVVTRIREIDLTCYTLILPVWQEIATKSLPEGTLTLGTSVRQSSYTPVNIWFDEAVGELLRIEMESVFN